MLQILNLFKTDEKFDNDEMNFKMGKSIVNVLREISLDT
jgi:hypothetical protein